MWKYKNKVIKSIDDMPTGTIGFVYEVEHIPSGKRYIGKKSLYSYRNVKIGKRELEKIKEERKAKKLSGRAPAKKKVIKESNWVDYYGSNDSMKQLVLDGTPDDFNKTILRFVDSKKKLTYYEEKELYSRGILEEDNEYLNDNISGRVFRRDFRTE